MLLIVIFCTNTSQQCSAESKPYGSSSLRLCNQHFPSEANIQHTECFKSSFYRSLKHYLVHRDAEVTRIDARENQPFPQLVGIYENFICGNKSSPSIQHLGDCQASSYQQTSESAFVCKACGKTFRNLKTKRKHLKRTKCDESSESVFCNLFVKLMSKLFLKNLV